MANQSVSLVVFLVFLAPTALAQQIYTWKDERGHVHFSHTPPAGVPAKKVMEGRSTPKAGPAKPPNQKPTLSPSAGSGRKAEDISKVPAGRPPDVPLAESIGRWLLMLPPLTQGDNDTSKPFSEWTPWESFDSAEACDRNKAILIANSVRRRTEFVEGGLIARVLGLRSSRTITEVDRRTVDSRCIPSVEFEPSKAANVFMVFEQTGYDRGGLTIPILYGRVFNRGQATARNVVVKYQLRNTWGTIVGKGEIPTSPGDISGITSAGFHGQLRGVGNLSGLGVYTEIDWSKD